MRRAPREEGARWLQQAVEDLRWAEDLAERGGYHIACFLIFEIGLLAGKCRGRSIAHPFREALSDWMALRLRLGIQSV